VDSNIVTFVNHGCRGTYNVGEEMDVDEFSVDPDKPIEALSGKSHAGRASIFDPVIDRHLIGTMETTVKDIKAGDEILDNYLAFIGSEGFWADDVMDLRKQCSGEATEWSVTGYETMKRED